MNAPRNRWKQVLDAYGADPRRWPDEDRSSLLAMLEADAQVRAWCDDAARIDALLDAVDASDDRNPPSRATRRRILAAAPGAGVRRRGARWAAVASLAAAAAVAVWVSRSAFSPVDPQRRPPSERPVALADLGSYATPTDVLLSLDGSDPLADIPAYTCGPEELGCIDLNLEGTKQRTTQEKKSWRTRT